MVDEGQARAWVSKVLGVEVGAGAAAAPSRTGKLLPIWVGAKDTADKKIVELAAALQGFNHPDLSQIAEYGLNGVTDKRSVGLMTALREADGGAPGAGAKVTAAVAAFRAFLDSDPIVDLIETNPFDVTVDLRGSLGKALNDLDAAVAA